MRGYEEILFSLCISRYKKYCLAENTPRVLPVLVCNILYFTLPFELAVELVWAAEKDSKIVPFSRNWMGTGIKLVRRYKPEGSLRMQTYFRLSRF